MSKKMPRLFRVKGTDPYVFEQMLNVVRDEDKTKEQLLEEVLRLRRQTCEMEASQSELARKVEAAREAEKRYTAARRDKVEEVHEPGERYYRALIENATDCVHVMKADGTILYESPSVARLFGYQPGQQVGKSGYAFVHLEDIPVLRDALDRVIKDPGRSVVMEFRTLDANGSWRNVETVATNLLDDPMVGGIVINTRDVTERKRMEEALRHSEKKLRFMFENARDAVILVDRNGKIVDIGGTAQNLLGYNPQTFIGVGLAEFGVFEEKELVRIAEIFKEAVKGGAIRGLLQTVVKRRDGSLVPVEVSTKAVEDNGKVEAFLCILRDISERKRAEEALQESEERFRTLIENISDAIMVLEWDGTIRYDSPSIRRVLSYEPQELVGTNIFELIHPEDRERAREALGPSFIDVLGAQVPLDLRMRHKDGSFGIMEGLVQNLLGDPKVQGILANYRDITERKSIEEALQQSEEKLRTIFDNASDVLLYLDNGGRVLDINNKIESVIGYTRDELVGVSFGDLDVFGPGGGQMASRLFTEFVQGETAISLIELELKHKDGSMVPVEVSTKPIVKDGKVLGQLNVIRDIRERKKAEASLARYAELCAASGQAIPGETRL
jgi:PAS domain S-box-containing protein